MRRKIATVRYFLNSHHFAQNKILLLTSILVLVSIPVTVIAFLTLRPFEPKAAQLLVTPPIITPPYPGGEKGARLLFNPQFAEYELNDDFYVELILDTNGLAVDGVQAIVKFDQTKISVAEIATGTSFSIYPTSANLTENEENGIIRVDAAIDINSQKPVIGYAKIATIRFRPVAAGKAEIYYVCTQPNGSNDITTCDPKAKSGSLVSAYKSDGAGILTKAQRGSLDIVNTTVTEKSPILWGTDHVLLQADDFYITAGNKKFTAKDIKVSISSDPPYPGPGNYTTLEATWQENSVEMRMYMYFYHNGKNWWASEIRTYNGKAQGNWITYTGKKFFKSPLGQPYTNTQWTLQTPGTDTGTDINGSIHFSNIRIQSFLNYQLNQTVRFKVGLSACREGSNHSRRARLDFNNNKSASPSATRLNKNGMTGKYNFNSGIRSVTVEAEGYLPHTYTNLKNNNGIIDLTSKPLLSGNVDGFSTTGDQTVNVFDFREFIRAYGTSAKKADFDCSGKVNILDFSSLISHWQ